jgi:hypothetical protein
MLLQFRGLNIRAVRKSSWLFFAWGYSRSARQRRESELRFSARSRFGTVVVEPTIPSWYPEYQPCGHRPLFSTHLALVTRRSTGNSTADRQPRLAPSARPDPSGASVRRKAVVRKCGAGPLPCRSRGLGIIIQLFRRCIPLLGGAGAGQWQGGEPFENARARPTCLYCYLHQQSAGAIRR